KPLALPCGQTPRLDSDVRVRKHIVRVAGVGPLSSRVRGYRDYGHELSVSVLLYPGRGQCDFRLSSGPLCLLSNVIVRPRPKGLLYLSYVIKSPQSSILLRAASCCVRFLVDVLEYFSINLSQLSVIAAAKISHFEILCRVYGYVPTIGLFRRFYVDASVFPSFIPWYIKKTLARDLSPTVTEFSTEACDFLATHPAPFQKFSEPFLCLVGLSRYYDLDDNVYLTFLTDPGEGRCFLFA
ncbi:hypothetical protein Tco_1053011, partial [Tanacetum coccineum]